LIAATKLSTETAAVPQISTSPGLVGVATKVNVTPKIVTVSLAVGLVAKANVLVAVRLLDSYVFIDLNIPLYHLLIDSSATLNPFSIPRLDSSSIVSESTTKHKLDGFTPAATSLDLDLPNTVGIYQVPAVRVNGTGAAVPVVGLSHLLSYRLFALAA